MIWNPTIDFAFSFNPIKILNLIKVLQIKTAHRFGNSPKSMCCSTLSDYKTILNNPLYGLSTPTQYFANTISCNIVDMKGFKGITKTIKTYKLI